jgi:GT2 family glycosyltransferase
MISAIIPSAGALGDSGEALIGGALRAAAHADEILVVTTEGRMTVEGVEALDASNASVMNVPGPFNFSHAVNAGAAAAEGNDLMLLNDDIALRRRGSPEWLPQLAAKAGDILGVLLLDPNERLIDHAGVWFGAPGDMPLHIGQGMSASYTQRLWMRVKRRAAGRLLLRDTQVLAVTGAAMLVRRRTFERLGGFDEAFPINYGDIDLCLRAGALGCRVAVHNSLSLVHRASSTRGRSRPTEADYQLLAARHAAFVRRHGIVMDPLAAVRHLEQLPR